MKTISNNSYYKLKSGETVRVIYSTTYDKVMCEKENGSEIELQKKEVLDGTKLKYVKSHKELWDLAKSIPPRKFTQKERKEFGEKFMKEINIKRQLEFFFKKLIELDKIHIETLGYYYDGESNKQSPGESLAFNLAEACAILLVTNKKDKDSHEPQVLWENWTNSPTITNANKFFSLCRPITSEHESPVTGDKFKWKFDGMTIVPISRYKSPRERESTISQLKAELSKFKNRKKQKYSTEETTRIQLLEDIFSDYGWMRHFDLIHLEPAKPLFELYKTVDGKFPKLVVEINIPTGKLTFANSLYDYVKDIPKSNRYSRETSSNSRKGRAAISEFHASTNQTFYVSIGNTCPHVYQSKTDKAKLCIGTPTEEEPSQNNQWMYQDAEKHWNDKGRICTDLWAFMATDRSNLPAKINVSHFTVTVPPGRYRLINHYEDEGYQTGIFCEISRIAKTKEQ